MSASATARYTPAFFKRIQNGSLTSAREIVPVLIALIHPESVADIGCGTGAWLSAFQENGVEEIWGVDGGTVDARNLLIPPERFHGRDLRQPLAGGHRFDLVISLEVGEHLPASSAETYVRNLTGLSDVIAFSAAIPNQGGEGHINEQWPDYWKALFEARKFTLVDCLRHRFWDNRDVERWYRQNLVLYVQNDRLERDAVLKREYENSRNRMLAVVHPSLYAAPPFSSLWTMARATITRALRRRFGKES